MALTVGSRLEDDFLILEIAGSLTLGPTLSVLRETARQGMNEPKLNGVILRLADVAVIDSAGLGELTVIYTLASKRGCPIRLVDLPAQVRKVLEMTRLDGLLPASADVVSAKRELGGGHP